VEVGSSTKQCWPLMPVSEGDPCGSVGDVCATGTYCTGVPPVCEVGGTAATGATCTPTIGCAADDYCQIDAGAKKGKCIQAGSMGTTCATDVNCAAAAPYCDVNVPPKSGKGPGSCQTGLFASFGTDTEDCKAFGGGK
jgi:septal ring-binding cell division protein DamX